MKFWKNAGKTIIAISIPFFLLMTAIRLLLTPLYPEIEYRMPYFPPDPYGFTLEDRLKWSKISIEYLLNDADLSFLASQKLDAQTPLYNDRELQHMLDVKILVQQMITVWTILSGIYVILLAWAWRRRWLKDLFEAFSWGGRGTIALIVLILVSVALNFNALFTAFHQVFFEGNSWLFLYSDSLIRLFPLPFWRDAFIWVGVFALLVSVLLIWIERRIPENTP
ncbi:MULTISPECIES: TIGR01906 family membrane protein [Anaerolinea]|uniref:TIGR01906 family membrane protein n=1 Tax=Anaerolinea TaxID=233189 RepID=UPI0026297D08|nr:TIGR01906 family membrane protein [Anaerolinea thermophila]